MLSNHVKTTSGRPDRSSVWPICRSSREFAQAKDGIIAPTWQRLCAPAEDAPQHTSALNLMRTPVVQSFMSHREPTLSGNAYNARLGTDHAQQRDHVIAELIETIICGTHAHVSSQGAQHEEEDAGKQKRGRRHGTLSVDMLVLPRLKAGRTKMLEL